jgi:hypothetical protein
VQQIDPFIPAPARHTRAVQQPTEGISARSQPPKQPIGTVEGFVHSRTVQSAFSQPRTPAPSIVAQPAVQPQSKAARARPKQHRLRRTLQTIGLILLMLFTGMAAQSLHAGELLIALYALYVLVRRIASRTTSMLVLISLGTIVLLRAIGKDTQLITNFAVYSFLLSFVGVLALAREVRHPAK